MENFDRLLQDFGELVNTTVANAVSKASIVPGSSIILRYIKSSYQNDPVRSLLEFLLMVFAIRYFLASKYSTTKKNYVNLESWEIDELVDDWEPEPLVSPLTESEQQTLASIPVIKGRIGPRVHLTNDREIFETRDKIAAALIRETPEVEAASINSLADKNLYLNFTSPDIFNLDSKPLISQEALKIIGEYGVGSCGPAGFYGNQDQHVNCEKTIARFLGTEAAILYSQGFSTPSSVIPCFFKRGDYIVVDESVNISLQKGIILSRAHVFWYKHNDMDDMEAKVAQAHRAHRRGPLPRRIIVTEGIFEFDGDSPDLKRIIEVKKKYKFRVLLDESLSIGVLGKTGRGLPEQAGVPRSDVDITLGSLANYFASAGGFCAGSRFMVEYQQITSLAYTFSATMPPYLANNTCVIIDNFFDTEEHQTKSLTTVRQKAKLFVDYVLAFPGFNEVAEVSSVPGVPFVVVKILGNDDETLDGDLEALASKKGGVPSDLLSEVKRAAAEEESLSLSLQRMVDIAKSKGILIGRQFTLGNFNKFTIDQGLRVFINVSFTDEDIAFGANALASAVVAVASELK